MDPLAALFARYAARGDVDALGEVFDRTAGALLRLALHLCHRPDDAEDLLQATFVRAIEKAGQFDVRQPLLPWLSGILAGEAKNLARRRVRRRTEALPDLVDAGEGPLDAAERRELVARLREHVATLPVEQRQALLLQLQHGLSPTDIAEVLDVPPGTVRMRLHRGLQALRRLLPVGLAVWLFGAFGTRGLAAVRTAVLRQAGAAPAAGVAALAAGAMTMTMKHTVAGVLLLLAIGLGLWWSLPPPDAVPPAAGVPGVAANAAAGAAAPGAVPPREERTAAPPVAGPRETTGSLLVRVEAAPDGQPLRDVAVWIAPGRHRPLHDPQNRLQRTGDAGTASFDALPPGPWHVVAHGFPDQAATATVATARTTGLALVLPVHPVRGVVVDELGSPVAGAAVRVGDSPQAAVPWQEAAIAGRPDVLVRAAATSAADGSFTCLVGAGEAFVAASHPAFASSRSQPTHAPGVDLLRLVVLPKVVSLGGRVVDGGRRPVRGALVAARVFVAVERAADGTWCGPPLAEFATTDAEGGFRFESLAAGNTTLDVAAAGHVHADTFAATTASAAVQDLEIVLAPAVAVAGRVRSADGTALPKLTVAAVRTVASRPLTLRTSDVQDDGRFAFGDLPAPPFELVVQGDGNRPLLRHAVATTDRAVDADLVLPPRPTLRGRVVDDGDRPLAHWIVVARDETGGEAWATTGDDGGFAIPHVPAARVSISAWSREAPADATEPHLVSPLDDVVLRVPAERLPRASVTGRLVDHTGQPLAGARLRLVSATEVPHDAVTAPDGTFALQGLPAGTGELLWVDDGKRRLRSVTLAAAEPRTLGDVRVLPVAMLQVEVVRSDGAPWRGWLPGVQLRRPGGDADGWLPLTGDGRLAGPVEPGVVHVVVGDPDLIAAPLVVELLPGEHRTVRLPVTVGRSLELVFAGDVDPTTGRIDAKDQLAVQVVDERGTAVLQEMLRRSPHGDGNWTLEHAFAFGRYTVDARSDSGRRYRGSFAATGSMPVRRIVVPRQP